jgi:hypothetical protein
MDAQWLPQVAQWPPAQEPQPLALLATIRLPPPASRLMAANTEMTRRASGVEQAGHVAGASLWLIERRVSKRFAHVGQ